MQRGVIANILIYKLHKQLREESLKNILISPSINMKTDLDLSLKKIYPDFQVTVWTICRMGAVVEAVWDLVIQVAL